MHLLEMWRCDVTCLQDISTEHKLKGMFLYIWRHMQHSIHSNSGGNTSKTAAGGFTIFQGALLRGSKVC
jgi:hypothetical protein